VCYLQRDINYIIPTTITAYNQWQLCAGWRNAQFSSLDIFKTVSVVIASAVKLQVLKNLVLVTDAAIKDKLVTNQKVPDEVYLLALSYIYFLA
jgi:hypothetical protein